MSRRARLVVTTAVLALALAGCADGDDLPSAPGGSSVGTGDDASRTTGDDASRTTSGGASPTTSDSTPDPTTDSTTSPDAATATVPALAVEVVADGLTLPWDVQLLPDGTALVTERAGRLLALDGDSVREVSIDLSTLFVGSEAGLMGLAVSPDFGTDRTIFLCHAAQATGERPDVRVTRWTLDAEVTTASADGVVVDGIPLTSGRHSGCRLLLTPDGTLLVGTGDAADESNPQDLRSLGGKVLAVTPDGEPADPGGHVEGADPRILTYGHRNVQGLALRPGSGQVWEVEHGSDVDDEVNLLVAGGNYGWDPGPGYDESVPMTDLDAFPDAVRARWSSGSPTHATSGAVFLEGEAWGAWDGALAVAELKGSGVTVLTVDDEGTVTGEARVPELDGTYGRLRSLTLDDGALWVTTSNGERDVVLRVTPRG